MRWGVAQAVHHARHRSAFGKLLVDQPLMQNVLADLAIESEAATAVTMRVARAYDEDDAPFRRIATAVMKYWVCKRAPGHAAEALECLGGNGYVEESGMPRLLRDSPLNSIWEGSGNVAALDVLRAIAQGARGPARVPGRVRAGPRRRTRRSTPTSTGSRAAPPQDPEFEARTRGVRTSRVALQASLLVRNAPAAVADAFCAAPARRRSAARTARCRPAWTPRRSSSARSPLEHAHLRGRRPGRAHHARPARARQRDHARDAARAGRVRGAGQPRPGRARDRAGRQRARASAAATTSSSTPRRSRRTTTRPSPGTPWSTGR